jgi:hypothetical protein
MNKFVDTQSRIIRVKHTTNFTQIHNEFLRNPNVSWKAKGLLCAIMSLPDEWVVKKTTLSQFSSDGRDATIRAFNELQKNGYVIQLNKYSKDDKGRFTSIVYLISDKPITENQNTDNKEQINNEELNNVVVNNVEINNSSTSTEATRPYIINNTISFDALKNYINN